MHPKVVEVASLGASGPTPAVISTGVIEANPGDVLIAQVLGRRDLGVDASGVSAAWGSSSLAIFPIAFTYGLEPGISYGRCLRHDVVAHQAAPLVLTYSGVVPNRRVVNVIRITGLRPDSPPYLGFDDMEELNYPFTLGPLSPESPTHGPCDFWVICHGETLTTTHLPDASWDQQLRFVARAENDGLRGSILVTGRTENPASFTVGAGPGTWHGVGFFAVNLSPKSVQLVVAEDAVERLNASPEKPAGASAELAGGREARIPGATVYLPDQVLARAGTRRARLDLLDLALEVELRAAGDSAADCYSAADGLHRWVSAALEGQVLDGARAESRCTLESLGVQGEDRPYLLATVRVLVPSSQLVGDATRTS